MERWLERWIGTKVVVINDAFKITEKLKEVGEGYIILENTKGGYMYVNLDNVFYITQE